MAEDLLSVIEDLTGEEAPLKNEAVLTSLDSIFSSGSGLGWSQLNEILLLLGYDRVEKFFFQYLVNGELEYEPVSGIGNATQFREGVDRFRKLAIVSFGNVKYAFKRCSQEAEFFWETLAARDVVPPEYFKTRHEPVRQLHEISGAEAAMLGYVSSTIDDQLKKDPENGELLKKRDRRDEVKRKALENQEAYLASDHMDVYVATSMREPHEFVLLKEWTRRIFESSTLAPLKLRWFDPTAAYCVERIDKGLAEALMLKRAKCTLYFVQEADTLGKDSELACTLAQGKPVVAFVPEADSDYVEAYLGAARQCNPEDSEKKILLDQLRLFEPEAAWKDQAIRDLLDEKPSSMSEPELRSRLVTAMRKRYDDRAATLRDKHPLGIQVNLQTGVANGVLVVRSASECGEVLRRCLLGELEFEIEENMIGGQRYIFLRESVTKSVFRVMTGDKLLTNAFWNFYLGFGSN